MKDYQNTNWWQYMDEPMKDLMGSSFTLLAREKQEIEQGRSPNHDYSFIVFPAAKAYEGFLKKLLYDMKLITKQQFNGERFRIGKSLNPHLPARYKWDWVFAKLSSSCEGDNTPLLLWETWKRARNRIFHYFPDHHELVTLTQAEELVVGIISAMDTSLTTCKVRG